MDFGIEKGQLTVTFTQGEMDSLTNANGDTEAFCGAVNEVVDASQQPSDCCRPVLYSRLPYEALHAVWRSQQVESSTLSAEEVHRLGTTIGLAMFGPRAIDRRSLGEEAVA